MKVHHDEHQEPACATDSLPSDLAIDDPVDENFVIRIAPHLRRLFEGDAVLGEVAARLVRVPREAHIPGWSGYGRDARPPCLVLNQNETIVLNTP